MMRRPKYLILISVLITCVVLAPPPPAVIGAGDAVQRFSMVVGANYGGPGRPRLRYAVSDARAIDRKSVG